MDQDKAEKPKRVMLLHLPVYEGDDIILQHAPSAAKSQWARQLLLRALQIDVQFMETVRAEIPVRKGEDSNMNAGDVRGIVKEEIEALLPRIEEAIQEKVKSVFAQKLEGLQDTIRDAIQEAVKTSFLNQQQDFFSTDASMEEVEGSENLQPWMLSARRDTGK